MAYVTEMPQVCRRGSDICTGTTFALRKRMKADGKMLYAYQYQCLACGAESGTVKASEAERLRLPTSPWDDAIVKRWSDARHQVYVEQREDEKAEWFRKYSEYLKTPAWQAKRQKVLKRANGICEGCGEKPPVQVHHKTYEHVGDEFLWELAAVCMDCHERAHDGKQL